MPSNTLLMARHLVSMKDDGNAVLLQIQDEGVGIKERKAESDFQSLRECGSG